MPDVDYDALATKHGGAPDYEAIARQHGAMTGDPAEPSSSALWMAAASKALPMAEQAVKAGLNAPNAPRVIQRAIGAGVRGASTAVGAAVGGVPGAVAGAAMSEGLTPTQQTIRGWLGRTATAAATKAEPATDAVVNYIEAMGANPNNLTGAALEYAKKSGRAILYDASGRASLVPAEAATQTAAPVTAAAKAAAPSLVGRIARGVSLASGAQGLLDLAQMAEPNRKDIGFLGIAGSMPDLEVLTKAVAHGANPAQAAAQIANGDMARFGKLMTAYMQSRQVK